MTIRHAAGADLPAIVEIYTPFGHTDYQTIVAEIKKFSADGSAWTAVPHSFVQLAFGAGTFVGVWPDTSAWTGAASSRRRRRSGPRTKR